MQGVVLIRGPGLIRKFVNILNKSVQQDRHASAVASISQLQIHWTIARRACKREPKHLKFMQTVWQGAVLHFTNGGPSHCSFCGAANDLQHVLWECPRWSKEPKFPAHLLNLESKFQEEILWQGGLPPATYTTLPQPDEIVVTGQWPPQGTVATEIIVPHSFLQPYRSRRSTSTYTYTL